MNVATKLGAYALGLAAVFGGALGVGALTGPVGADSGTSQTTGHVEGGHGGGGSSHGGGNTPTPLPGGLQVSQDGYTLNPRTTTIPAGRRTDFRFTVTGPDGKPVTRYTPLHGKRLHLIIARRDLSGFQHLHPTEAGGGVWTIPLTLPDPGAYRFFTDVRPEGAPKQLTLGTDITAPGDYEPTPLPSPAQVAEVDGYEVRLDGALVPGRSSRITLTVSKDGRPVTDLEPYLEAYGHLVALRDRDLAYLHVHPDGEPGDGRTRPGPSITFYAEVPSTGTYRLYLDFQHKGKVRTAEFTATAGAGQAVPPQDDHGGGDHRHAD
ncbi:hypothetical protein Acsp03_47260 [Actinomadura sp. NBRC 104412]|uniref:hypothetical protein n=1 Tax=Actinomadura sp. NBRC 104412 TaxID=3032203 RepID=UPI0024A5171F|nr:hypothetical protein [Actinomadura sp. NBRC 104412]GLZ07260.1 hypothetical protein Acsp03_47260 [Actinomadura sp. NBRC 104412]